MLALGVTSQEGTSHWENISLFITLSHIFFQLLWCWLKLLSLACCDCCLQCDSVGDEVGSLKPLSIQRNREKRCSWWQLRYGKRLLIWEDCSIWQRSVGSTAVVGEIPNYVDAWGKTLVGTVVFSVPHPRQLFILFFSFGKTASWIK